jgi:ZIP family zinc transporter
MSPLSVFLYATLTAAATGLGALPFFYIKKVQPRTVGICNALAAGLMLGASLDLVYQAVERDWLRAVIGLVIGFVLIIAVNFLLHRSEEFNPELFLTADLRKMTLIVAIMTVHSFAEGVSIGFAFGGAALFGLLIALALAIHNIPEGLAISATLVPKGVTPGKAAAWSIFTSLPQPIMAVPAFLFINTFRTFLPVGLGFAAGAMLWLIFAELLPEAQKTTKTSTWLPLVSLSVLAMLGLGIFLPK